MQQDNETIQKLNLNHDMCLTYHRLGPLEEYHIHLNDKIVLNVYGGIARTFRRNLPDKLLGRIYEYGRIILAGRLVELLALEQEEYQTTL